jgi:isoleucyl-tRNA synthetase
VLTHGFVVDGKGEKMAKSRGNVISPEKVINQYGAELLRLWVVSENYQEDMRISQDILKRLSEAYRKIRNTCRFMLGNLSDFVPEAEAVSYAELKEIDKWALYRLNLLKKRVLRAYETYEFHTIYHSMTNFCINDLSAVYLDILKDRLYCSSASEPLRKTAQSAIYIILKSILGLLAPVLSFTAEEAWQLVPGKKPESVHLCSFPSINEEFDNQQVAEKWDILLKTREQVLKLLEEARVKKEIGNSLEAAVDLKVPPKLYAFLQEYSGDLSDIFIVSRVRLEKKESSGDFSLENLIEDIGITISKAEGAKCQRCWKYFTSKKASQNPEICNRCAEALQQ